MKIIISHGYTDTNKGDAAIALGTIAAIRQVLPEVEIVSHSLYSESHIDFKRHAVLTSQAGVRVVEGVLPSPYLDDTSSGFLSNTLALVRLSFELFALWVMGLAPFMAWLQPRKARALTDLKQADLVVVRGGQYLHNESGRVRGLLFLGRMLINIAIPLWLKRPTVVWGLSIGPLHGRLAQWGLVNTLRGCQAIVVREKFSADYLCSLGLINTVSVAPDLAFMTVPKPEPLRGPSLPAGPRVAVTTMNWSFPGHPNPKLAQENYLQALFETLQLSYHQYGLVPLLVVQVHTRHQSQDDYPIIQRLYQRLQEAGVPVQIIDSDLSPGALSDLYSKCDVVLATRLHSIILAACGGTPSVAIRYQGFKTQGIMDGLGLTGLTHDISTVESSGLIKSLVEVLNRRAELGATLEQRVTVYRQEIAVVAQSLLGGLKHND